MRSRLLSTLILLLVVVAACAAAPARIVGGAQPPPASFGVVCNYSHSSPDDPIVRPGMPGVSHSHDFLSHSHDFFGNTSTDASSTAASLRFASTTCNRPGDRSAYWAPTVLLDGAPVTPTKVQLYYNNDHRRDLASLPAGLKIVAGDAHASGPQSTREVAWQCSDNAGSQPSVPMPPRCLPGTTLKVIIRFPGCWDGVRLDSVDHKSHMAYAMGGTRDGPCPAGYPVKVVSVNAEFKYPVSDGSRVTLSSGAAYTLHGDFFNAWDGPTLQNLVTTCVNAGVKCKN